LAWSWRRMHAAMSWDAPGLAAVGERVEAQVVESGARKVVAQAVRRNISIGPRKLNDVCKLIRRRPVESARAQLLAGTRRRVRFEVAATLKSAVANAVHTLGLNAERLIVDEAYVAKGVYKKVLMMRAKGRGSIGHKYFSHLTVRVREVTQSEWETEFGPSMRYRLRRFRPAKATRVDIPKNLIKPWTVKSQMDINVEGKL